MKRDEKAKTVKRAAFLVLTVFLILAALTGCKRGVAMMSEGKAEKGYTLPQIMVVATTEKNHYEAVCGSQIWSAQVKAGGGKESFSALLTDQVKSFMEQMKIMTFLAKEKKITLTADEHSDMEKAAGEYYHALSKEDISSMGVSQQDVQTVFEDYRLANKLVDALTGDVLLEVSDNEAKVITVEEVKTDQEAKADQVAQAAKQEDADFQRCASDAGLTIKTRQLGRAEESKTYEDAAFSLTTGQVSGVIEDAGTYYVLKCVNDYDEKATADRKEKIYQERRWKAFTKVYDKFKPKISLTYSGDPWKSLDLSKETAAKNADFFAIYKKYTKQ